MILSQTLGAPSRALAAIAVIGLFGLAAGAAQAQTNVTIYGRVDAGVDFQTNVALKDASGNPTGQTGSKLAASGNQWGTSMIGFKGSEDLGGGLSAFFLLESGFDATNGSTNGSALFNRRSYVGLNGSAGSIKFGKNLFIVNDVWNLDPTGQQFMSTQNLVKGRNWPGANNVIEYQTPTWGGFNATVQTSLGEQAGSTKNGRKDGISLLYTTGGLELRAIYDVIRDANGRYTDVYTASKDLIVGGTYTADQLKLFAGYENVSAPDTAAATDPDKINHYWIGANYAVTPALALIGAAFHAKLNHDAGSASLFMVGANYNLSKRTLLYAAVGTMRNKGNADFGTEFDSPLPGHAQNGGYAGISHSF
ncbi:Outer membrane protein (porin) [Collimonas sp. OK242]|jgi:predicted porin|uniref:porin n=1 Tax=Collimonas sp. OK242 TaxID=1798195 RepID=UPI000898B22B|nr:porin [Collimonas sp. OK242]SDX39062.1 Outer membrane protein (porin) [Collimonas sp. OK242]